MTYSQALDYIHSVTWKGSRPGLERITELCRRLGDPQKQLTFIHVAGTNGKGSTSAMLSSILTQAGLRVGLFTSPFILRFNERMKVNGEDIPDDVLAEITDSVRPHADAMEDVPTEFELITAIAFVYFLREACDVVVLEVGMGGRLDSTNIIPPASVALSVITGIAMDHTAFLGDTPEAIAKEKAGIIKKGVPVLFGGAHPAVGSDEQTAIDHGSVASVIREAALTQNALYAETDLSRLTGVSCDPEGATLTFGDYEDLRVSLAGVYQPYNTATVLTALELLKARDLPWAKRVTEAHVREGLALVRWRGRFETLCRDPLVISDGGHNPEGVDAAVAGIKTLYPNQKVYLLSGVMADKDFHVMVRRMCQVAERVFTVRPDNSRAMAADAYAEVFREAGVPAQGFDTVSAAVHAAMDACRREGKILLTLGSLYMYGEICAAVAAYEERRGI